MQQRPPKPPKADSKTAKRADALRDNLLRRKQQARARDSEDNKKEKN